MGLIERILPVGIEITLPIADCRLPITLDNRQTIHNGQATIGNVLMNRLIIRGQRIDV